MIVRYFAYGSNMDPVQMEQRVSSARALGVGRLRGYRLAFTHKSRHGGAVADVVQADGQEVLGVIYELTLAELGALDRQEVLYRRIAVEIECEDTSRVDAWIYLIKQPDLESKLAPRRDYLQRILDGAKAANLPADYIARLRAIEPNDQ